MRVAAIIFWAISFSAFVAIGVFLASAGIFGREPFGLGLGSGALALAWAIYRIGSAFLLK